jgi:hypothetical protein
MEMDMSYSSTKMPKSSDDWRMQFEAARRKIHVATYHVDCLREALNAENFLRRRSVPPIPIQAHFEGVVVSVIAAIDQVA